MSRVMLLAGSIWRPELVYLENVVDVRVITNNYTFLSKKSDLLIRTINNEKFVIEKINVAIASICVRELQKNGYLDLSDSRSGYCYFAKECRE